MNIFLRELKANTRSLLVWSGIVVVFVSLGFVEFTAYADNPEIMAMLNALPPALLAAFNMEAFNLTTVSGFFGLMYTYIALLLSLAAVLWGSDTISKEERDKTVEFSLSLPVTRARLVTAKTLAAIVNCIGLLVIAFVASLVNAARFEPDSAFFDFLLLSVLALFIMQMVFLSIGIFLGCAMKRYRQASSVAIALLLGTYFLSILAGLHKNLEFLKYVSPFKYFDPATLLHESKIDITFVAISAGIIVVCLVGAYVTYAKRDMYI
jgi:ABC-2 type transport system permease protein